MVAAAEAGYRSIAIDFRGYGESEHSAEPEKTDFNEMTEDIVMLLDILGIPKVFLVGKDFGALPVFMLAIQHPDRVAAILTIGIPFLLPGITEYGFPLEKFPKGFYILRWGEPGRAEKDFGRFDVKTVIRKIYVMFSGSELQVAKDDQEIMDLVDASAPLPPWFSEDDLDVYAKLYEKSGFRTALQVPYRTLDKDCGITNPKITLPAMLIMGEKDYVFKMPGMDDYIRGAKVKNFVPNLDIVLLPEGNHFAQEKLRDEVNKLVIGFLDKHSENQ